MKPAYCPGESARGTVDALAEVAVAGDDNARRLLPEAIRHAGASGRAEIRSGRTTVEDIQKALSRPDCHGCPHHPSGLTHCPGPGHVNGDRNPSLSVTERDGKLLIKCHAGCTQGEVIEALSARGLWVTPRAETARETRYAYRSGDGQTVAVKVRFDRSDGTKTFVLSHPDGRRSANGELSPSKLPLYLLPELLAADPAEPVVLGEGEKATEAARRMGFVATCAAGGASQANFGTALDALRGRTVLLAPDNDEPGRRLMETVATQLAPIAACVRTLMIPNMPPKGDVYDFEAAGRTPVELRALIAEAIGTPVATADASFLPWRTAREMAAAAGDGPEWVIDGLIALGAVHEISGKTKAGKSTLIGAMVKAIATGGEVIGRMAAQPAAVLYMTEEGAGTFREILQDWDLLDSENVHILHRFDTAGMKWPDIMAAASQKAEEVGAAAIVIDTLGDWAGLGPDEENDSGAALAAMRPVREAAAKGPAVILVRHDRKSGGELGDSGRGSSAFAGACDVLYQLTRADTPGHERRRILRGIGRYDVPPQIVIEWTMDGRYVALGDAADVERQEAKAFILDHLPSEPQGSTIDQIREAAGNRFGRSTVDRALKDLRGLGVVLAEKGAGKSGRAVGYWLRGNELSNKD